jgi:hypothetical protein
MSSRVWKAVWETPRKAPFVQDHFEMSPWGKMSAHSDVVTRQIRYGLLFPVILQLADDVEAGPGPYGDSNAKVS